MSGRSFVVVPAAMLLAFLANVSAAKDIPPEWVGRYQAAVVSSSSGLDGDQVSTFGKGMTQTTIALQTLACAQSFDMEISKSGAITGRGRLMYVYRGKAMNAMASLAPSATGMGGGFAVNLKDGKQYRDWSFTGQVTPDGEVEINGLPNEPMDYYNVNRWEKHRPWSALPPVDKNGMRGPFKMQLTMEKGRPTIRVDRFLPLDDALIKRVHYQTQIFRSDDTVTPSCRFAEPPPPPKCAASEYLKVKSSIGVDGIYTIETSRDLRSGDSAATAKSGGGAASAGFSTDSAGNVGWEGGAGLIVGSTQFNPTDGSYSMTIGVGVETSALVPGPAKLSEKVELVYDSACGFGIKGTAGVSGGAAGSGVEGAIFFTKGL